jgi:signal transduction histidine kinase
MYEPRAVKRGIDLHLDVAQLPPFRADADRIVQAVGNLLGNAIKFTPRGGSVTFAIERHPDGIGFRVTDSGPGIAAADVPHLFDRFWQAQRTRRGGAGLGLAIARGIAEAHGGRIDVVTAPGEGSTFTLVLPMEPPPGRGAASGSA